MDSLVKTPSPAKSESSSKPDTQEVAKLLRQCSSSRALLRGKSIHETISRSGHDRDTYLGNLLVDMYGKCRRLEEARQVFDNIRKRNVFSWNILLAANALNGEVDGAIQLLWEMHQSGMKPDRFTFTTMLQTFMKSTDFSEARKLHFCIYSSGIQLDVVGYTELIRMYGHFRSVENAKRVFDEMPEKDPFAWTAMLSAYSESGQFKQALDLFWLMRAPDKVAFIAAIDACGQAGDLKSAMRIYDKLASSMIRPDSVLCNALVSMFGRCSCLEHAYKVFNFITIKTIVSWTAMIGACVQNGEWEQAMELFERMIACNIQPNERTYVNILEACSGLGDLSRGEALHEKIRNSGMNPDEELQTALISMYGRCGGVEQASELFDSMKRRDVIAWSSMITACSENGRPEQALKLFYRMQAEGVKPNRVTFVSVLSACSSGGFVEEACWQFNAMVRERRINPGIDHLVCMIDVLGKAGWLQAARGFIEQKRIVNEPAAWLSLLASCKMQGDEELALYSTHRLLQLGYYSHIALSLQQFKTLAA